SQELHSNKSQRELLLEKIRLILDKTDPERWKQGGEELKDEDRFKKPRQAWELVFTLDIPAGTLVLRNSTPVKSDFAGKGFHLVPISAPIYTVEIRAQGWHHSELTDPYKRSRIADRRCTVLAEGQIAAELYQQIADSYKAHYEKKQAAFDTEAYAYVAKLPHRLREETLCSWERLDQDNGDTHYTASIEGMHFDVSRTYVNGREVYGVKVSKRDVSSNLKDIGLMKEVYHSVEELGQTSRLATLSKALEQL
ncbi:MAG: hypothetical protein KDD62_13335, partial [Bdellovibrionales bacterium]|nr:hypothetical protein [Bdellovibrionales bacterium]